MKLWLVRHGETDANVRKVFQGWMDLPLNPNGQKQAEWLRQKLREVPFTRIYASPLRRTVETAAVIAEGLSRPVEIVSVEALKELHFGQWEGLHFTEAAGRDPERYQEWLERWEEVAPPDGESALMMFRRVCAWFDRMTEEAGEEADLLIVTHEGVILQILAHLLGRGLAGCWQIRVEPGSISRVEIRSGFAVITKLNQTE